jgi:hypothetical protein
MIARVIACLAAVALVATPARAQFGDLGKRLGFGHSKALSEDKIASGLKEALHVGTGNAVASTGRTDGYFKNDAIKIPMPANLRGIEKSLRTVGYGHQVDQFILSMNRAAERSAPLARDIFWNAITHMSFDDARQILSGPDTAATAYFRAKTSDTLTAAFRPVVEQSMNEVGATRYYQDLQKRAKAIPFVHAETYDINAYVVANALDGLFHVLGEEERKIRSDPAARVTTLLQEVFH